MPLPTRPFLILYVAWHPAFLQGKLIADALYDHYRRQLFENVAGGSGLPVMFRSQPSENSAAPQGVDFEEGETSAVIVLYDEHFAADSNYCHWLEELSSATDAVGLRARVFPVAVDGACVRTRLAEQALRWDKWNELGEKSRSRRLISGLSYQFARMLRSYLERLRHPTDNEEALEKYLKKVQIFLSHSKRDGDGERIARRIRQALFDGEGLASFFDVHDIAPGLRFDQVILNQIRVSAVVAIHTDSFSSREWCRREIIEAKRANVPLVVANCLSDVDERGFPYMGNVPIVRMDTKRLKRIDDVIGRLIDEVLKDFLWRCRVEIVRKGGDDTIQFLPRPPELISLTCLTRPADRDIVLVYPDPPLGTEEERLFEDVMPRLRLRSMTAWIAESGMSDD